MARGRKRKDPKDKLRAVTTFVPLALFDKLDRLAKTMDIPKSKLLRSAMIRAIAEAEHEVSEILMEANPKRTKENDS